MHRRTVTIAALAVLLTVALLGGALLLLGGGDPPELAVSTGDTLGRSTPATAPATTTSTTAAPTTTVPAKVAPPTTAAPPPPPPPVTEPVVVVAEAPAEPAPAPAPPPPPPPPPPPVTSAPGEVGQVLDLHNQERAANGLPPLSLNDCLSGIAQPWADHMAATGDLRHNDLGRLTACGGSAWGENIGYDSSIPAVHAAWMGSSGHRANILNPRYTQVGIGVSHAADGTVWVAVDFMG